MKSNLNRREALGVFGAVLATAATKSFADDKGTAKGCVVGQPEAAKAGQEILDAGGNVVDAIITAALVAGVAAPQQTGLGGYGGHMVIALPGKKVTAIDFNSAAPLAAKPDMFAVSANGAVKDSASTFGWRAVGVPGIPAGVQLALDHFGTLPFRKIVQPALLLAREGFAIDKGFANAITSARNRLAKDPASAKLLLDSGEPRKAGTLYRNLDLARTFEALAAENSGNAFYHGDIAQRIAAGVKKNGGLLTAEDLASYKAREVEPLQLEWRGQTIFTAPLTAGGLTVLQALGIMKALAWENQKDVEGKSMHARLEALRVAWHDRLALLGDPEKAEIPMQRLLSAEYAKEQAKRIEVAVREGKPLAAKTDGRPADGTIHLSAVDKTGGMAALTLTHGGAFGAQVTVAGLGLILGHGMSRFEPRPGHPNSVGPGKRPLHNMCPTIVCKDGKPIFAVGGRGGRKIPNSVFEVLLQFVGRGASMDDAVAAGRIHTEGGMTVSLDAKCRDADAEYLKRIGYTVAKSPGAVVSAVMADGRGANR